jgi:ribonucleotide reductase alpha subunit
MSNETTTQPYAICTTEGCDVEHVDREAMREHQKQTMAPTGEPGVVARSHSSRVVNPTPEEIVERAARSAVNRALEDAQERAFDDLDREIRSGRVTEAAVTKELRYYSDFADGWDEYRREAGE